MFWLISDLQEGIALTIGSFSDLAKDMSFTQYHNLDEPSKVDKLLGGGRGRKLCDNTIVLIGPLIVDIRFCGNIFENREITNLNKFVFFWIKVYRNMFKWEGFNCLIDYYVDGFKIFLFWKLWGRLSQLPF